jgi:hypothetical protein
VKRALIQRQYPDVQPAAGHNASVDNCFWDPQVVLNQEVTASNILWITLVIDHGVCYEFTRFVHIFVNNSLLGVDNPDSG